MTDDYHVEQLNKAYDKKTVKRENHARPLEPESFEFLIETMKGLRQFGCFNNRLITELETNIVIFQYS